MDYTLYTVDPLELPPDTFTHKEYLSITIITLMCVQFVLIIATVLALMKVWSGWPPKKYMNMIE